MTATQNFTASQCPRRDESYVELPAPRLTSDVYRNTVPMLPTAIMVISGVLVQGPVASRSSTLAVGGSRPTGLQPLS
ncbi:hypothetical protein SprV_0401539900 [Sparganum proliferum]